MICLIGSGIFDESLITFSSSRINPDTNKVQRVDHNEDMTVVASVTKQLLQGCQVKMIAAAVLLLIVVATNSLKASPDSVASATLYGDVGETLKVSLYFSSSQVEIEFNGPNEYFHGIGFNGTEMENTYAIIINASMIEERYLGLNAPGTLLDKSVTVVNNTVNNNIRQVILTRDMKGKTSQYYSFQPNVNQMLNIIYCYGTTGTVQYHGPARNTTTIKFAAP